MHSEALEEELGLSMPGDDDDDEDEGRCKVVLREVR